VILNGDIASKISEIKQQPGADLGRLRERKPPADAVQARLGGCACGSRFIRSLRWGRGANILFAEGTIPLTFRMTENQVSSKGVLVVNDEARPRPSLIATLWMRLSSTGDA
jgi:hypothetical protein